MAVLAGCASPLRFGQELQTGGRAGLTQWEVYDAYAQMYKAQVFLNIVRLVEYGEAPLHFEFGDVIATITDQASIGSGFEFFDSPAGAPVIAGAVVVPVPDTNIKFMPSLSSSRNVVVTAKAKLIGRENWVYDWYYTVADQYKKDKGIEKKDIRFYKRIGSLDHNGGRLALWFRHVRYGVREVFEKPFGVGNGRDKIQPKPEEELGSLTAILSFMRSSNPSIVTRSAITVDDLILSPDPVNPNVWRLIPDQRHAILGKKKPTALERAQKRFFEALDEILNESRDELVVTFPVKESGGNYSERLKYIDLNNFQWEFELSDPTKILKFQDAYKDFLKLDAEKQRAAFGVVINKKPQRINISSAARTIAKTTGVTAKPSVEQLLETINDTLNRTDARGG